MWILEFEPDIGHQNWPSITIEGNTLQELIQNAEQAQRLKLYEDQLNTGVYVGKIYWKEL